MVELAGIIILGILAQWVAWRFKIPAILPLILIGLIVGPIAAEYLSSDGSKWIEPIWNGEKGLFPGDGLYYFVSIAISIILFEGGLTLRLREIQNVGSVITKLISVGSLVTFSCAAVAVHYIFNLDWQLSFLFSALIIVTGPTVITPILRNIPLKKDVSAVLKWEGILIDPIGALVAVLVFEFIFVGSEGGYTKTALIDFGKIILFGGTFGFTFAHALIFVINKKFIPHYLLNVVTLSVVLLVFIESEVLAHESGLLAVVVMGMVLGNSKVENLKELLYFKESLSVLLISILFILLAANINMDNLMLLANWKTVLLFAIVVFIIRPLGVFISSYNSSLSINEKLFISWVGPRGIVAAGIASLFGSKLMAEEVVGAEYITPLVFMIVLGTVLLNATTARLFARMVGVYLEKSEGIIIIGASEAARAIGKYFHDKNSEVVLVDNNIFNVEQAKKLGLKSINTNIYSDSISDDPELSDIGYLFALTPNPEINSYAIDKFSEQFGENGSFTMISNNNEGDKNNEYRTDFNSLSNILENYPTINEAPISDKTSLKEMIANINKDKKGLPLFIIDSSGMPKSILYTMESENSLYKDDQLVYVGPTQSD